MLNRWNDFCIRLARGRGEGGGLGVWNCIWYTLQLFTPTPTQFSHLSFTIFRKFIHHMLRISNFRANISQFFNILYELYTHECVCVCVRVQVCIFLFVILYFSKFIFSFFLFFFYFFSIFAECTLRACKSFGSTHRWLCFAYKTFGICLIGISHRWVGSMAARGGGGGCMFGVERVCGLDFCGFLSALCCGKCLRQFKINLPSTLLAPSIVS